MNAWPSMASCSRLLIKSSNIVTLYLAASNLGVNQQII